MEHSLNAPVVWTIVHMQTCQTPPHRAFILDTLTSLVRAEDVSKHFS